LNSQKCIFTEKGRRPCVQLPALRIRSLYLCIPVTGEPVIPPGNWFPFRCLLLVAGLVWKYSNPPPDGGFLPFTNLKFITIFQTACNTIFTRMCTVYLQIERVIDRSDLLFHYTFRILKHFYN
jgi:hypothetical protein